MVFVAQKEFEVGEAHHHPAPPEIEVQHQSRQPDRRQNPEQMRCAPVEHQNSFSRFAKYAASARSNGVELDSVSNMKFIESQRFRSLRLCVSSRLR